MGKSKDRRSGDRSREQELLHENKKLKREISSLKKQLGRLDLDRYATARTIIEDHYQEKHVDQGQKILRDLRETWKCFECPLGYLEIILFSKRNETFYVRKCDCCENRTKSQKYSPQVQGIVKNS